MKKIIKVIQIKRGFNAKLTEVCRGANKPADGEPIFEIDTGKLKFGDGIHDYGDLPYFDTGEVEIEGAVDGQILVYDQAQDKWLPKKFVDNKTIEYDENGLKIAGFVDDEMHQGHTPVINEGTVNWQQAVTQATVDAAAEAARLHAYEASQSATAANMSAQSADISSRQAEQFRDATAEIINQKLWFGTRAEYENDVLAQGKLKEGTIYFIREYDWEKYPHN